MLEELTVQRFQSNQAKCPRCGAVATRFQQTYYDKEIREHAEVYYCGLLRRSVYNDEKLQSETIDDIRLCVEYAYLHSAVVKSDSTV